MPGGPAAGATQYFFGPDSTMTTTPDRTLTLDDVRALFQRHDLRCTRQRELVYAALAESKAHPTAEDLHLAVHATDPGLSLATLYNTLEAFLACGLGRKLPAADGSGPCRYDADTAPHVHLATDDGRVLDVPPDLSERLLACVSPELIGEIESRMGVRVRRLNVQVVAHAPREA